MKAGEVRSKAILLLWVTQTFLSILESLETSYRAIHSREEIKTILHPYRDHLLDFFDVLNHTLHGCLIKTQGFVLIVNDTYIIANHSAFLMGLLHAVGATNGLKKSMVLHRLVKVHTLENRGVKSSQEFACNDDELERIERVAESVEKLVLLEFAELVFLVLVSLIS